MISDNILADNIAIGPVDYFKNILWRSRDVSALSAGE